MGDRVGLPGHDDGAAAGQLQRSIRDIRRWVLRIGLADDEQLSPDARSSYAFRGMRERYGLVRKRESILPVELVVQGSIEGMSLGAFPRIRMPRPTPDAFLFR